MVIPLRLFEIYICENVWVYPKFNEHKKAI